jgi:single-strand selective monofunctional uracil DNA glycosylase
MSAVAAKLVESAARLRDAALALRFDSPVAFAGHPLDYAWDVHRAYLERFARGPRRVLFLGMNPGPFGMAQTGVPFGEVNAVRDWLGLAGEIRAPSTSHPKRPVHGWGCRRSEVSGRRLWGLFRERFTTAEVFFSDHFVHNHCPVLFLDANGTNLTPDRLRGPAMDALLRLSDSHLRTLVAELQPRHLVGIGRYATLRLEALHAGLPVISAPHPSPANPASHVDWAGTFSRVLEQAGAW